MGDDRPIVFISCGQSTAAERELGKRIAKLVEDATGRVPHTIPVLDCVGLVAVML